MQSARVDAAPPSARLHRFVLLFLIASLLFSCATQKQSAAPVRKMDLDTMQRQLATDIETAPTRFRIPLEDDRQAWSRAILFFKMYVNSPREVVHGARAGSDFITNVGVAAERFQYTISRAPDQAGYRYTIECQTSPAQRAQCQKNARNVARFIREGQLELSHFAR